VKETPKTKAELIKEISVLKRKIKKLEKSEARRMLAESQKDAALRSLQESEARYLLLSEHTTNSVWLMDMNLKITYHSPSVRIRRGFTPEEIIEMPWEQQVTPESLKRAFELISEEIPRVKSDPGYNPRRTMELDYYCKDGTTLCSENIFSIIRDKSGIPVSILCETQDITERKRAEKEKSILEERLRRADKMEAIGTLAGGIAHDFNNLLMGIQGNASMILMNLNQSQPDYERVKQIEEHVQSGADLTRQLLGFARGGRFEVKPSDMNAIIEKASFMFGRTRKEISLHRKPGQDLWSVEVDRGQMEQVFMNLFVNALQAMPGGGDIYLETQNLLLSEQQGLFLSMNPGKYVKITVTDTGTGMDDKTRERIFDPFFTTKAMGRGTGLGLASVYGIIKGHLGIINVYSEPGHGTTFTIYLPASEKEVEKEKTSSGEIVLGRETILLVDDEKMVLDVNRKLLETLGYNVYAANSGQEALAVFTEKKNTIDLVILDLIMPGMSGGEIFNRLREIHPGIKILLTSGYSLNGKAQTIMDRGCNGFLQKPFHREHLSGKVREVLGCN
jgi:PAS domain S-box-containing protein